MLSEPINREPETAKRMSAAAVAFFETLSPEQRNKAVLDFNDVEERENWHYIPRERCGLPLRDMDTKQRSLAQQLLASGLSSDGHQRANMIIQLEPVLADIEGTGGKFQRDPELYYVSLFGEIDGPDPWGWRFEGHHISVNYTIVDGNFISTSPLFFGANPAEVRHGDSQGLRVLQQEEDIGRSLLMDLDGEQRKQAIISAEAPQDIITRNVPHVRDEVAPEGLPGVDMNLAQQQALKDLVAVYVNRLPDVVATREHDRLECLNYATAHFAWAGAVEPGKGHYYRVQSPAFVAEYDNTQNDANHIHAVWRNLINDFGRDLLKSHYRAAH